MTPNSLLQRQQGLLLQALDWNKARARMKQRIDHRTG
jgi:hypothetical protein